MAGLIVVGILLVVLEANPDNQLVEWITDAGQWVVGPFKELFTFDERKLQTAVNWGIAAVVYLAIARVVARVIAR